MDELRIVGPLHSPGSGYSKLCRAALRTALVAGFKVQAVESDYRIKSTVYVEGKIVEKRLPDKWSKKNPPTDYQREEVDSAIRTRVKPNAPTLLIQFPEQVGGWPEYSSGPRLAWTMVESDRVTNESWLKGLYGADVLMAPSRYVWNTFREYAPEQEVLYVPLPVDNRLMEGWQRVMIDLPRQFTFFSVFNCRERKHWRMMLQAFSEEFDVNEKVALIVKPGDHLSGVTELAGWLNVPRTNRQIIVIKNWLSDDALAAWYHRSDCYVLPSCEGFGLPFVEAAFCGKPSIALDDGGSADIVDSATGWRIPSERRQVIGNLPHVYDSTNLFACPKDIQSVKRAFRLAFESRKTEVFQDKGQAAQFKAESEFTPEAIAPKLIQAVERAREVFKGRTRMWSLPIVPEWALMVGDGFGDALACIGNAQHVLRGNLEARIGILHYGKSKAVESFLLEQACVREVRQIVPKDEETRKEVSNEIGAYYAYPSSRWLPELLKGTDIPESTVALTQVHWPFGTWPIYRPADIRLNPDAVEWADAKHKELGEFVMVQPFSTSSVDVIEHWPHWIRFLRWLLHSTESTHRLVFCGLNEIQGLGGPNVVNLIGQTPSMEHVFALSDRAKGIITTCNGLANYAAVRGLKALIAGNHAIPRASQFWPRFMSVKSTKLMLVDTSLEKFTKAAESFLQELSK